MDNLLSSENYHSGSESKQQDLESKLQTILKQDFKDSMFAMLAAYQRVLANNHQREQWPLVHEKLQTLFMCGKGVPVDGPMIGIPVSIRDSDYFQDTARLFGKNRSLLASIELMATAWNATFADTGLWMGKTFEPVSRERVSEKCDNDPEQMHGYDPNTTRIGRNFFREPGDPDLLQSLGLPVLEQIWKLKERPLSESTAGFDGDLLASNLKKEERIPYSMTGGIFLANMGTSVVPQMNEKTVYQLNYRWPRLNPAYPMTRLIDEIVQIGEGIYLGQLVLATKHYSLGTIDLPFIPGERDVELGEPYKPNESSILDAISDWISKEPGEKPDYGYQNNGFFLMMDPAYAKEVYADECFPQLRPRYGEMGYQELGYNAGSNISTRKTDRDWVNAWKDDEVLYKKFTSFITEPSTQSHDDDIESMRLEQESVLQMLQRISQDISEQTQHEDHLKHFEALHRLFRSGVAPKVIDGLFQGSGARGYNVRLDGRELHDWYGQTERTSGFDYYHGATLNLHWGFSETFCPDRSTTFKQAEMIPSVLANAWSGNALRGPNIMNVVWHSIGKYVFPWAGKSFERINARKLSMLVDESPDLSARYPSRVKELKQHVSSFPHYLSVKKNRDGYWNGASCFSEHLQSGSWDQGMSKSDKSFWVNEAATHWVMGYNLQDKRILPADALMRISDMNYREPEPILQQASEESGSPFVRQGYCFLGAADQQSILPMNSGDSGIKRVFQFHYRFPLIGGPIPIGFCLDELVEIADGLYLGQLIYSTALDVPFNSSVSASEYRYQLFGYFLLMDDDWEHHRQAIKLDTLD